MRERPDRRTERTRTFVPTRRFWFEIVVQVTIVCLLCRVVMYVVVDDDDVMVQDWRMRRGKWYRSCKSRVPRERRFCTKTIRSIRVVFFFFVVSLCCLYWIYIYLWTKSVAKKNNQDSFGAHSKSLWGSPLTLLRMSSIWYVRWNGLSWIFFLSAGGMFMMMIFFLCVRFFRRRRCRLCLVLVGCVVHDEGLRIVAAASNFLLFVLLFFKF